MAKAAKATTKAIEKKFAETAFRLGQERNDFLLPQVRELVRQEKWINLRPEYQRRLVWDDPRRSLFIESLLLNVPIPPVFLYEWELSRYEVMDGQQRLNSIVDFYDNLFPLTKLETWKELNGMRYGELPETLKRGLDRRRISATVLLLESSSGARPQANDVRKLVFERLNTGGQQLNAQELRHCLNSGDFDKLLISLSQNALFTEIWEIPAYEQNVDKHGNISKTLRENALYSRMRDCEIVLRFFAFRQRNNIRGSIRSMLDRCMEDNEHASADVLAEMREAFETRLSLAKDIFGDKVFKYEDEDGSWKLSQTLYDGVMVALDRLWDKRKFLKAARSKVSRAVHGLLKRPKAYEVIVGRPNTANAVKNRMDLLAKTIESATKQ